MFSEQSRNTEQQFEQDQSNGQAKGSACQHQYCCSVARSNSLCIGPICDWQGEHANPVVTGHLHLDRRTQTQWLVSCLLVRLWPILVQTYQQLDINRTREQGCLTALIVTNSQWYCPTVLAQHAQRVNTRCSQCEYVTNAGGAEWSLPCESTTQSPSSKR